MVAQYHPKQLELPLTPLQELDDHRGKLRESLCGVTTYHRGSTSAPGSLTWLEDEDSTEHSSPQTSENACDPRPENLP